MPAIQQGTVLVSGASGFIAVHVVKELLDRGYTVRGTVRSSEKGEWLKNKFPGGKFDYVIVEDLEKEGGFDEAVKGVDAIEHTASPFHFNAQDPYKDLVNPAVNGTVSILKSAKKYGDKVKRVVITSSYAAVLDTRIQPVHTFTEEDWNTNSPEQLEKLGKDVDQANAYRASKTLAERAAWKFLADEKPDFDLVTICPPFVIGPIIHQCNKPESLNTSAAGWYGFLAGKKSGDDAQGPAGNMVDVRNLAEAHVQAISVEEAGNNRFAITCRPYSWQDALDVANADSDVKQKFGKLPEGKKGAGQEVKQNIYDGSKSKKVLGIQYIDFEKTIIDMSNSMAEYEAKNWDV